MVQSIPPLNFLPLLALPKLFPPRVITHSLGTRRSLKSVCPPFLSICTSPPYDHQSPQRLATFSSGWPVADALSFAFSLRITLHVTRPSITLFGSIPIRSFGKCDDFLNFRVTAGKLWVRASVLCRQTTRRIPHLTTSKIAFRPGTCVRDLPLSAIRSGRKRERIIVEEDWTE